VIEEQTGTKVSVRGMRKNNDLLITTLDFITFKVNLQSKITCTRCLLVKIAYNFRDHSNAHEDVIRTYEVNLSTIHSRNWR